LIAIKWAIEEGSIDLKEASEIIIPAHDAHVKAGKKSATTKSILQGIAEAKGMPNKNGNMKRSSREINKRRKKGLSPLNYRKRHQLEKILFHKGLKVVKVVYYYYLRASELFRQKYDSH